MQEKGGLPCFRKFKNKNIPKSLERSWVSCFFRKKIYVVCFCCVRLHQTTFCTSIRNMDFNKNLYRITNINEIQKYIGTLAVFWITYTANVIISEEIFDNEKWTDNLVWRKPIQCITYGYINHNWFAYIHVSERPNRTVRPNLRPILTEPVRPNLRSIWPNPEPQKYVILTRKNSTFWSNFDLKPSTLSLRLGFQFDFH